MKNAMDFHGLKQMEGNGENTFQKSRILGLFHFVCIFFLLRKLSSG